MEPKIVTPLEFLQGIVSSNKNDDRVPVGCVSLGSSYWRELTRLGSRPKESVAISFLPVGRAAGSGWSHKIITEEATAFRGGGLGKEGRYGRVVRSQLVMRKL